MVREHDAPPELTGAGPGVGTPACSGDEIKCDIKHADAFERIATVRENKWEHVTETHLGPRPTRQSGTQLG